MSKLLLIICALTLLALTAGIVWASIDSNLVNGLRYLVDDRWGIVTLLDVYAGVIAVATWIWMCERRMAAWLPWVAAMLCLGHVVSLVYILIRSAKVGDLSEFISADRRFGRERSSP